jgi:signal transduction histidine kinase/ActR/RegA family two-component response regulator
MKHSQSVLPVDLSEDFRQERADLLQGMLFITGITAVVLFVIVSNFNQKESGIVPQGFLILAFTTGVSYLLNKIHRVYFAAYTFVIGMIACFGMQLMVGPSSLGYALLILPIAVASLTLEFTEMSIVTTLVSITAVVFPSVSIGLGPAIIPAIIPIAIYIGVAAAFYYRNFEAMERIRWTLDNQRKDNRRAEMFYDQSEQLQKAYLEVQHYSSKLEIVNKQLEEAQKRAEQASKAKSTFLSNMSHELRTPLNVIIGYSNSMLNMPKMFNNKTLSEAHKPYVQLIEENGHYLVGLISDVLDLGKIEAGKLELHLEATELPALFRGVMATSVGLLKGKPVQLRSDFPDKLPALWADPMRVRQIILNLMSNAIKFTESGSVTLMARADGDFVNISVVDTGIGIPESALEVIFDRFQQAENDTDKKYGGTGLGLDISKQLSLMHGGDLTVTSEIGRGSTFTARLPIMTEQTISERGSSTGLDTEMQVFDTTVESDREMILLVEDDMNTRRLLRTVLEQANYVVVDTNTGEEALDLAGGLLPAAIILDVYLPDVSGWDVLQMLKQNNETAIIPVIVCTADQNRIPEDEVYPSYYLRKPATPDALLSKVDQALRALKQIEVDV